jgi:hypothetical protein
VWDGADALARAVGRAGLERSFTAEAYEAVRAAWRYDPSFDLVAELDGGGRRRRRPGR